jgi:uncharacterized membrane protein HdeD (DUF308 family)
VTDTARVLLTAGVLSLSAGAVFARHLRHLDADDPTRIIGQLRLAQAAAIVLAALGGARIGLAIAHEDQPLAHLDLFFGVAVTAFGAALLYREPAAALRLAAGGFIVVAMLELAHRPGSPWAAVAPIWFVAGNATYDLCAAAICFWASRR